MDERDASNYYVAKHEAELTRTLEGLKDMAEARIAGYNAGLQRALELIGEDEQSDFENYWDTVNKGRNKLRAELRTRIQAELEEK